MFTLSSNKDQRTDYFSLSVNEPQLRNSFSLWNERKSDTASRWVHGEFNLMFTFNIDKNQRKISLSLSLNKLFTSFSLYVTNLWTTFHHNFRSAKYLTNLSNWVPQYVDITGKTSKLLSPYPLLLNLHVAPTTHNYKFDFEWSGSVEEFSKEMAWFTHLWFFVTHSLEILNWPEWLSYAWIFLPNDFSNLLFETLPTLKGNEEDHRRLS